MKVEIYTITFSADQPGSVGPRILEKLQQTLTQTKTRTGWHLSPTTHHVLVVDAQRERARYLEGLLRTTGYHSVVATTTVEAFTHILQGVCVPFAVIMGQEDPKQRFFLNRLFQRMEQLYDWDLLLIRLQAQPGRQENIASLPTPPPAPYTFPHSNEGGSPPSPATPPVLPPMTSLPGLTPFSPPPTPISEQQTDGGSLPSILSSPTTPVPPIRQSTGPISSGQLPSLQQTPPTDSIPDEKTFSTLPPPDITLEGQDIGHYHIIERLGLPQASNTYRAYDRLREKDIALKALHTDSMPFHLREETMDEAHLFQQEANLTEHLEHPNILRVLNTGRSYISGASFIYKTMTFCQGGSLAQWLREHANRRMFTPQEVLPLVWQLAAGLQYLHDHELLYQNFKFSNILLKNETDDMRALQVALSDIPVVQNRAYIAKSADTYAYVAPERWQGEAVPASDQYALAAITYELLVGRPPFQGSSENTMRRLHTTMQPQPPTAHNPALAPAANDVLLRALAKKPEERFPSVTAFAQIFRRYFP